MGRRAYFVQRLPLKGCLYRVRDRGRITPPCHGAVVGAYIRLDDPYRVHPHCLEHQGRPAGWGSDECLWQPRLQVQGVQEQLIRRREKGG